MVDHETTVRGDSHRPPDGQRSWRLVVTAGNSRGRVIALQPGEWILGRDEQAQVQLDDSGVSRRHAKLVFSSDGRVVLLDLESTNGTFVNDSRVELAALHDGHRVRLGPDAQLRFEVSVDTPAPAPLQLRPRELEVARLVAQGKTNPQIADVLGIRPRTVATHLENIYRRLSIGSRAELTRCLTEAGMT